MQAAVAEATKDKRKLLKWKLYTILHICDEEEERKGEGGRGDERVQQQKGSFRKCITALVPLATFSNFVQQTTKRVAMKLRCAC